MAIFIQLPSGTISSKTVIHEEDWGSSAARPKIFPFPHRQLRIETMEPLQSYMWRVPARSSSQFRGSDYSAAMWEDRGAKPTIIFGWEHESAPDFEAGDD